MKSEISQILKVSGPVSVHPFADQIVGFQAEIEALKAHASISSNVNLLNRLNEFSDQLAAWDAQLDELASPRRLVEAKSVFHAMKAFIEEPEACSDHMTFFDDLLGAGDELTARITEVLAKLAIAVDQSHEILQSVVDTVDQITADLAERVVLITDQIAELLVFENRLAEVIAMVTAAADPCLKTIIERTAPPDVKEILNIN
jgi:phage-related minor tail protein